MTSRELTDHFYKQLFKEKKIFGEFIFPANASEDWMDTDFVETEIANVVFENINMSVSGIVNSKLNNCIFRNCNLDFFNINDSALAKVRFDQSLFGTSFRRCDLDEVSVIYDKQLGVVKDLRDFKDLISPSTIVNSKGINFENTLFYRLLIEDLEFDNCQFKKVHFVSSVLKHITFKNCVFQDCSIVNCQMDIQFLNSRVEQNLRFESIKYLDEREPLAV